MDNVTSIFNLRAEKKFNEDEAYELLNLFLAVTSKAKIKINALNSRLEYHQHNPSMADEIQTELNTEINKWSEKIRRLGGTPLSLYQVRIPTDGGSFLWSHPQATLEFQID